jgi:hypothetical protein
VKHVLFFTLSWCQKKRGKQVHETERKTAMETFLELRTGSPENKREGEP